MVDGFFDWISSRNWPLTINVFSDLAVGFAALLGISAIWNWRNELVGKDKYQVGKDIGLLSFSIVEKFRRTGSDLALLITNAPVEILGQNPLDIRKRFLTNYISLNEQISKLHEANWQAGILHMPDILVQIRQFEGNAMLLHQFFFNQENKELQDFGKKFLTVKDGHDLDAQVGLTHNRILELVSPFVVKSRPRGFLFRLWRKKKNKG